MAECACGYPPLFICLVFSLRLNRPIKWREEYSDFPTGFDTILLIGQYFSSGYFWAIAEAMLHSMVEAIAELQKFGCGYRCPIAGL